MRRTALFLLVSLAAAQPKPIALFNGKDLAGWEARIWDGKAQDWDKTTPASAVWTVKDGILHCTGRPVGYLRTTKAYENYILELEWRWPKGSKGGNSGVLLHATTEKGLGIWPKSIESQLHRGNAGDFWAIGTTIRVPDMDKRKKGRRHLNLTDDSEKPIGEWNKMKVACIGDRITVHVNGDLVNAATKCSQTKGRICLQSEGHPIHFRNVKLTPVGGG